jgi:hypothetical protein
MGKSIDCKQESGIARDQIQTWIVPKAVLFAYEVHVAQRISQDGYAGQILGLNDWQELKADVQKWPTKGAWRKARAPEFPREFLDAFHPVFVADDIWRFTGKHLTRSHKLF